MNWGDNDCSTSGEPGKFDSKHPAIQSTHAQTDRHASPSEGLKVISGISTMGAVSTLSSSSVSYVGKWKRSGYLLTSVKSSAKFVGFAESDGGSDVEPSSTNKLQILYYRDKIEWVQQVDVNSIHLPKVGCGRKYNTDTVQFHCSCENKMTNRNTYMKKPHEFKRAGMSLQSNIFTFVFPTTA